MWATWATRGGEIAPYFIELLRQCLALAPDPGRNFVRAVRIPSAVSASGAAMAEPPIPPLIPPDAVVVRSVPPPPLPALPTTRQRPDLVIGVAAVSHSGRVRDRVLLDALGWRSGDRLGLRVADSTVLIHRQPGGTQTVNARGQVFLPAGVRAMLGIGDNDRVVLVADPAAGLLRIHPRGLVTALLAGFYDTLPGAGR